MREINLYADLKTISKYRLCRSERRLIFEVVKNNIVPEDSKTHHNTISRLYKRIPDFKSDKLKSILTDWYSKHYDFKETYRYEIMLVRKLDENK